MSVTDPGSAIWPSGFKLLKAASSFVAPVFQSSSIKSATSMAPGFATVRGLSER